MPRVFIADKLESSGVDLLTAAGIDVDNRPGLTGEALLAALQAANAVIVRSATKITAAHLKVPGKLKAIARAGVGVDTIDVPAATRKGIVVMNPLLSVIDNYGGAPCATHISRESGL